MSYGHLFRQRTATNDGGLCPLMTVANCQLGRDMANYDAVLQPPKMAAYGHLQWWHTATYYGGL